MAEVTVKQLADSVGAPVERLLRQMQEAGLAHQKENEAVSEDEKQVLLSFLKRSHGEAAKPAEKITLKRKSTGTLKSGQGKAGRNVTVEVRRKRTYVKRSEIQPELKDEEAAAEATVSQSEIEAQRIQQEEAARKAAEEQTRQAEADRKAEAERRAEEERLAKEEAVKKAEQEREAAKAKDEPKPAPVVSAADIQAKEQSEQRGGKRGRGRERSAQGPENKGRRRELSLKSERRTKRKQPQRGTPLQVDQQGGACARWMGRRAAPPEPFRVHRCVRQHGVRSM